MELHNSPAMLKKSFVSLSFSSKKIQILQLGLAKKKVKKYLSVDLPEGLIKDRYVQDKEGLAKLLKQSWRSSGFKEKSVGIVIPEFSTFTKSLTLPKLTTGELDEAVRWQAEDFLPWKAKEMIMDWKTTKEDDKEYQILAVAVRKDLLEGYVDAAALAGLYPLVVETPSLSLVRISDGGPAGRLIIYNHFGEAILIIAQGEKIIGSSVVDISSQDELLKTSSQILDFYKEAKIEKIFIAGLGVSKELPKDLEKTLGKSVEWVTPQITGLSAEELQEYLIPISLQLKEPSEPSDEHTINLLPPVLVKKYERTKLKLQIWSLTLMVTFVVWVCFLMAIGVYLYMAQQINSFEMGEALQARVPPEKAKIIAQVKEVNETSAKVLKITKASVLPQKVFNAVTQVKPEGVSLLDYRMDLDTGQVSVSGISSNREVLIEFKQGLEENEDLTSVSVPISSFEVESDLEFEISFVYKPAVSETKVKKLTK
jgi:hypothetical protein